MALFHAALLEEDGSRSYAPLTPLSTVGKICILEFILLLARECCAVSLYFSLSHNVLCNTVLRIFCLDMYFIS